ncbi:MAG: hypothetical protein Aurels2KO_04750 [Aureliella sp.]
MFVGAAPRRPLRLRVSKLSNMDTSQHPVATQDPEVEVGFVSSIWMNECIGNAETPAACSYGAMAPSRRHYRRPPPQAVEVIGDEGLGAVGEVIVHRGLSSAFR